MTRADVRYCEFKKCGKQIAMSKDARARFCTKDHAQREWKRKKVLEEKQLKEAEALYNSPKLSEQKREGALYKKLKKQPDVVQLLLSGTMTATAYAQMEGITTAAVTRAVHAIKVDLELTKLQGDWESSWRVKAMLPTADVRALKEMGLASQDGTPEFESLVDEVVRAYSVFSRWYFNLEGKRPLI